MIINGNTPAERLESHLAKLRGMGGEAMRMAEEIHRTLEEISGDLRHRLESGRYARETVTELSKALRNRSHEEAEYLAARALEALSVFPPLEK